MAARPPASQDGISFPKNEKGEVSTTDVAKKIFATSFEAMGENKIAQDVINEKNWRYKYNRYILKHVECSVKTPQHALKSAEAGLDWIHRNFELIRDGKAQKFNEAMDNPQGNFFTGFVRGNKPKPAIHELAVPYKGRVLKGEDLINKLKAWSQYGTIEVGAADAIEDVVKHPAWVDLSDKYFVLLGAGSAMGPYLALMALGANVIALDLDRPNIWKRLISIAENSSGSLTFPLKKPQKDLNKDEIFDNAGCNLITQAPEVYNWLKDVYPDKELMIGCYVYLDGDAHVKVYLACDGILKKMSENRKNIGIGFLCTPTDAHLITDQARRAALYNYSSWSWRNWLVWPIRLFAGHRFLVKNALSIIRSQDGKDEFSVVDGLVVNQGPNYALAKRMQHWRAITARARGCLVSTHVAPSTSTASVVHNRQFAWAYDGMPYFVPYEIFSQETSNSVMTAILIHDLCNPKSVAHPTIALRNPLELFKHNSFHGGVWRSAYKVGSIGEVSVLIHFAKVLGPYILLVILSAIITYFYKVNFK